ncbi:sensor histidine kinase [Paenibacillus prosopidis]|uniref:Oxygen sensor histidine kinase NreB n=1 Tax=Paenibacillus prosopidis TaxID=630520 RepID=A0A368W2Q4_9BACL|nr:histidine kinase [Paenibacillus prosopidis]RCW48095.1 signal transduction histidine kinase [Paenibacillus prosopidis]
MFVILICLECVSLFIVGIPEFYKEIRDHCIDQACKSFNNPPPGSAWLAEQGILPGQYALAYTVLYILVGGVFISTAGILFIKNSRSLMGLFGTLMLVLLGITFTPILDGLRDNHWLLDILLRVNTALGFTAFLLFFFVFPTGRFAPLWTPYLLAGILTVGIPHFLFPGSKADLQMWSPWAFLPWVGSWMISILYVQVYRYRKLLSPLERQQTKWVVYGVALAIMGLLSFTVLFLTRLDAFSANPYGMFFLEVGIQSSMLVIPIALSIAILRSRLWDIDPLVNRTIVYGILTISVIALYTLSVWYLGKAFQTSQWWTSLIATSIVAVSFTPLKEKVQRWINKLMYGDTGDPYSVLVRLGKSLEEPLSSEAALEAVVKTIRAALRLPYAAISLYRNGELAIVAEDGEHAEGSYRKALIHRGEMLGYLHAAPRSAGETFTASDLKLLDMLVRQAGVVVENVRVTFDLKLTAAALQESREQLIVAREEERKRLRRDLHDDMAPRLAAIALTAAAAEDLLEKDPATTKTILTELRSVIRATVTDIREMVYNMRPPALDELGLISSIRERVREIGSPVSTLNIDLDVPHSLPPLPAAVEVAAYRIITEAMVNVLRHSHAQHCTVKLSTVTSSNSEAADRVEGLLLEIADDGDGVQPGPDNHRSGGIGLSSMRERAEELGGYCKIEQKRPRGTVIRAYLPILFRLKEGNL